MNITIAPRTWRTAACCAPKRIRSATRLLAIVLAASFVVTCTDATPTGESVVASIELTVPPQVLRAGNTLTMGIKIRDSNDNNVDNVAVYWSSSNTAVAIVSGAGVVTAVSAGEVTIAASALGKSATKTLTIIDREVATVQIAPTSVSVRIGTTVTLAAQTLDAEGRALTGRTIAWSSSNTAVATVTNVGVVSAIAVGAATITATSEGRTGTAAVTATVNPVATVVISPASDTLGVGTEGTMTATLRDAGGLVLTNRTINWNSSNVQVANVSSTGVITALSPGNAIISAVSEGRVGTASLLVLARLASTVTLTPSSTSIIVGTTLQLTPQITDPAGNILIGRPLTYVSDNPAVATVTASGLVSAITPGTARITATSEGKIGTATIVVNPLPVAKVSVSPIAVTVLMGATRPLVVQVTSETGVVLSGRAVTWTSGAPTVASVSATGVVTPIAPGIALIVAVVEGVAGFATITVQLPAISSVVVAGSNNIAVGGTALLTATPRDNAGAPLLNRVVTWSSSDENIAFVSSAGLIVGLNSGSVTITATSEGVRGTFALTVR